MPGNDAQMTYATDTTQPETRRSWRERGRLLMVGFMMGSADIVPGVSGGTVAFILGVYEQLIASIKAMTGPVLRNILRREWREALRHASVPFLLPLLLGIMIAIFSLSSVLSWLLREHPVYLWAFFFGLIVASIRIVIKRASVITPRSLAAFVVAAVAAYVLMGVAPTHTPETPLAIFLSGAVAICAMILPGISGSFILIILGKYDQILDAVVARDVITLGIFMLGAVVGLALFSRLLSWLLARHHDLIVLVLAGLMLGSLRKVWPWKETLSTRTNSHGEEVPVHTANILPVAIDETIVLAAVLCIIGALLILGLERLGAAGNRDGEQAHSPD